MASRSCALEPGGAWSEDESAAPGQELVIIGVNIDGDEIKQKLDACLVSVDEAVRILSWDDPFPVWIFEEAVNEISAGL